MRNEFLSITTYIVGIKTQLGIQLNISFCIKHRMFIYIAVKTAISQASDENEFQKG